MFLVIKNTHFSPHFSFITIFTSSALPIFILFNIVFSVTSAPTSPSASALGDSGRSKKSHQPAFYTNRAQPNPSTSLSSAQLAPSNTNLFSCLPMSKQISSNSNLSPCTTLFQFCTKNELLAVSKELFRSSRLIHFETQPAPNVTQVASFQPSAKGKTHIEQNHP